MLLENFNIFYTVYDNEPTEGDTNNDPPADTGIPDKGVNSQIELNSVLKKEKEKFRKQQEKLISQLEDFQKKAKLTADENATLESQLEELRTANLTAEQKAQRQTEQLKKEYDEKLTTAQSSSESWQKNYTSLKIDYEINDHSVKAGVPPHNVKFVKAILGPNAKLYEDTDEDGKPVGSLTAKVKFQDQDSEGKPVDTLLTISEAVKRMKELPEEFGSIFEAPKGGIGGTSGTPGKKIKVSDLSMDQYAKLRKENPAAIYG